MPKKTKKEKLLALYHKKIRLLESKQTIAPATTVYTTPPLAPTPTIMQQEIKNISIDRYFLSDLKKSLFLITLIIGLEISLYFAKLIK